ncbi:outer membrane protein [Hansschlegelia zhihuaiae]|uniref:Porin family protein n=1 Tax=Hansschlegelia zhihuaiae TaxID=405005 RepID=A0A4Q0MKM2_9HYPH|nr:outer membrane protein [Hansschlegelia zhihuaiae]RXF73566.1 porin family protein [Hansschlegelia zhihuaiae]
MLRTLSLAAIAALSAPAVMAADLPMYEPAPAYAAPAPAPTWSGGYVGAQAGYGWGNADNKNGAPNTKPNGAVVGGYVGYDHQFDGSPAVIGVDSDLNYNTAHDSKRGLRNDLQWSGATRGKLGYAMDSVMVYGAAGVAYGGVKARAAGGSTEKTAVGYTVGGGVEAKVADNVTARAEYRYNDYGSEKLGTGAGRVKSDLTENRVMGGLAYKFSGW